MGRLTQLTINEEGFAFNPSTGESFMVNRTGIQILKELQAGNEAVDAALRLTESYSVAITEALRDIIDFQARLKSMGLT